MSIYVDLDGTLAKYENFVPGQIGSPVPAMLMRVQKWIEDGKTVVIFTARAHDPGEVESIKMWLKELGLPPLNITNVKGYDAVEFWDDRAIRVRMNTGEVIAGP